MKNNKLIFFLTALIVCGAITGRGDEPSADAKQFPSANQDPESVITALQAKLGQTRALLFEIQDMLAQATKNMDKILDENKHTEKNKAALEEYNRSTDAINQEIKNTRSRLKETEKQLDGYTKQTERFSRLQAELEKAQKERLDSEAEVRQADAKLAETRKNLDDMKNRFSELTARTGEAKKQAQKMQNAKSLLEADKNKRAEILSRAEETVAITEKAEKERLLLASRLAELEQAVPSMQTQQKESADLAAIQGEIEKESQAIRETEEKIKKDEKAREAAERNIAELNKQLKSRAAPSRGGEKEGDLDSLKVRLADLRKQRAAVESRMKESELALRQSEQSAESLVKENAAENQRQKAGISAESAAIDGMKNDINAEIKALDEAGKAILQKEKMREDNEKNIIALKQKLRELRENAPGGSRQNGELESLPSKLADIKKQRAEADERLKSADKKLSETEKENTELANMLAVENQKQKDSSSSASVVRARIQGEIESELKALNEITGMIAQKEKACVETEKNMAECKRKIKESKKNSRIAANENDLAGLQARLADARKERAAREENLKVIEKNIRENETTIAGFTNMLAVAMIKDASDRKNEKTALALAGELENETKLLNQVTANVDMQIRELKALEEEKGRLNSSVVLIRENAAKAEKHTSQIDDLNRRLAGQKKIRADMELKLGQTAKDLEVLRNEITALNQSLVDSGKIIMNNENELKTAERIAGELQKEKELARESADRLAEKEKTIAGMGEEKNALQSRLNEALEKSAAQKDSIKILEAKRRAIDESRKAGKASEQKYTELVRVEKDNKRQINELERTVAAADKENKQLAARSDKISSEIDAERQAVAGEQVARGLNVQASAAASENDPMVIEQAVLQQARAGDSQPSAQQPEEKTSRQTMSRKNRIAEAEKHYAAGIQKWDDADIDGAIDEFKKTADLNPDAVGAYYNISLAYLRQGNKKEACKYAYDAGECYVRMRNFQEAARMAVLMTKIDVKSPLIKKLRSKIAVATK